MVCQIDEVSQTQGLEYTLNDDMESYTVTGIGTATDLDLIIPFSYNGFPVTGIGSWAFKNCTSFTNVTIPDSVTSIGSGAFSGCSSLTSVTIPNSVTSIGNSAFRDCTSLTSVTIPESVTTIGEDTFNYCISLTSVTISGGVTTIGEGAFCDCNLLTSVTMPESVTLIGDYAFYGCMSLTSVTIPESVTSIGEGAFSDCVKLVEVFNLSSLPITKGSKEYGEVGYYALNVYTSKDGESKLAKTDDGYIFYEDGDTVYLIGYTGSETELTLPDKYNNKNYGIFKYAFYGCDSITSVTIGNGVTYIGYRAFRFCYSLTSVYYNGTAEEWSNITIATDNSYLLNATRYYYSETEPATNGNFWHYVDGEIVVW